MIDINVFAEESLWRQFLDDRRDQGNLRPKELEALEKFIEDRCYLEVVERMLDGQSFDPPTRHLISKLGSEKKRVVYTYPEPETMVLRLLAWRLHEYDHIFSPHLYSFRRQCGPGNALKYLCSQGEELYSYKVDIHDYFNSIPTVPMCQMLREYLGDGALCDFLESLLMQPYVIWQGESREEMKGVMAGTPTSAFLANLYLVDMDEHFKQDIYARYSDDIIIFACTAEERDRKAQEIRDFLGKKGLTVNPAKECWTNPGEPWTYLGITRHGKISDISPVSVKKLKGKLRRRARSIERWKRRKGVSDEKAVKAYIRAVNRKLYDNPKTTELTWCRWYFPMINTDRSLRDLDHYIQTCARYVACGNYGKKSYQLRYEDMKELGYRSLVHEYWAIYADVFRKKSIPEQLIFD